MLQLNIPFFLGVQNEKGNSGFPESYLFRLNFDNKLKLYRQKASDDLDALVAKAYKQGSMLNGEMNNTEGKIYADAALNFIKSGNHQLEGKRILEIGCGNGYILSELEKQKAICVGIEPGPQIQELNNPNITLIQDFYPSDRLEGKFDLILHFNVLEHIKNPEKTLLAQLKLLNEGGSILIGVPNCEPYLFHNDISLFVHEHCNYFTRESMVNIANSLKVKLSRIEEGANGGMLFAEIKKGQFDFKNKQEYRAFDPNSFETSIKGFNSAIAKIIKEHTEEKVAIYCPLRAINMLFMEKLKGVRFVDDKPSLKGKFLPGFVNAIESFEEIKNNPPACIIIFSRTFGDAIKSRCTNSPHLKNTKIYTLDSIAG